jgi:hypothetical protein
LRQLFSFPLFYQSEVIGATLLVTSITTMSAYAVSTYEDADLGIKLEYPSSWKEMLDFVSEDSCPGPRMLGFVNAE